MTKKTLTISLKNSEGIDYKENVPWFIFSVNISDWLGNEYLIRAKLHLGTRALIYEEETDNHKLEKIIRDGTNNLEVHYNEVFSNIKLMLMHIFKSIITAKKDCFDKHIIKLNNDYN